MVFMEFNRAQESLQAAQLCLQLGLVNSAANRAYYAMFAGATFTTELIQRRKPYRAVLRDYLPVLVLRSGKWRITGVPESVKKLFSA